jgi:hypothetical protein
MPGPSRCSRSAPLAKANEMLVKSGFLLQTYLTKVAYLKSQSSIEKHALPFSFVGFKPCSLSRMFNHSNVLLRSAKTSLSNLEDHCCHVNLKRNYHQLFQRASTDILLLVLDLSIPLSLSFWFDV